MGVAQQLAALRAARAIPAGQWGAVQQLLAQWAEAMRPQVGSLTPRAQGRLAAALGALGFEDARLAGAVMDASQAAMRRCVWRLLGSGFGGLCSRVGMRV